MPSFQDSAVIFFIALLLFGPKKLPELARQLGKLMGEFRRASNEFRMQMEDELRMAEQAEQQKKIAEMQAAAPVTPAIAEVSENTIAQPSETIDNFATDQNHEFKAEAVAPVESLPIEPLPIATSGELNLMPPSTGLPVASSSVSHAFDSIPHVSSNSDSVSSNSEVDRTTTEAPVHG
jgi:sec-independent protein translocase protein TatB